MDIEQLQGVRLHVVRSLTTFVRVVCVYFQKKLQPMPASDQSAARSLEVWIFERLRQFLCAHRPAYIFSFADGHDNDMKCTEVCGCGVDEVFRGVGTYCNKIQGHLYRAVRAFIDGVFTAVCYHVFFCRLHLMFFPVT